MRDKEFYLSAVKNDGLSLQDIPKELRDKDICLTAVRQNGIALRCVPEHLRDKVMCLDAVTQNAKALRFVPDVIRNCITSMTPQSCQARPPEWFETSLLSDITQHLKSTITSYEIKL